MTNPAKKSKKRSKNASAQRTERRFLPIAATNAWVVRVLGASAAILLGAGAWGSVYATSFAEDEKLRALPTYFIAAGAIALGITIWLGTSSEPPVRVGDPGIAVEKGETRRMPWWAVKQISFDPGTLAILVQGKDEAGTDWSFRVSLKTQPEAVAWILQEATDRIPKKVSILDDVVEQLPRATSHAGTVVILEPLQVVGRKSAVSGKTISYEPDARVCTRCERVYLRREVPAKCKCGASLAHLRGNAGEDASSDADDASVDDNASSSERSLASAEKAES